MRTAIISNSLNYFVSPATEACIHISLTRVPISMLQRNTRCLIRYMESRRREIEEIFCTWIDSIRDVSIRGTRILSLYKDQFDVSLLDATCLLEVDSLSGSYSFKDMARLVGLYLLLQEESVKNVIFEDDVPSCFQDSSLFSQFIQKCSRTYRQKESDLYGNSFTLIKHILDANLFFLKSISLSLLAVFHNSGQSMPETAKAGECIITYLVKNSSANISKSYVDVYLPNIKKATETDEKSVTFVAFILSEYKGGEVLAESQKGLEVS